jgi:hypothetical protein
MPAENFVFSANDQNWTAARHHPPYHLASELNNGTF